MSRSIHQTRRELEEVKLRSYADAEVKAAEQERVAEALRKKRGIKASAVERRWAALDSGVESGLVPVRVLDTGPHVVYAATVEDIEEVQRRLPRGVLEGVPEIVLSLGEQRQRKHKRAYLYDPDPVRGRIGAEWVPGFWLGLTFGEYHESSARISLYGFVADGRASAAPLSVYLKLCMLATFAHEAAHHFDFTRRVARGRWRATGEKYACRREHRWAEEFVAPYLEERYPAEVAELLDWLEQHGGARFQLGELILDGWPTRVYQMEEALTDLVNDVAAGKTRVETRLGFAGALLMADLYERSLEVVERVLGEEPENERALELWAANWRFLGRYAEAASLAREILERNPRQMRAWWTLTASLEELGEWEQVVEAATEWLAVGLERADRVIALQRRCGAYWKLGMKEESDRDLEALRALRWTKRLVGRLLQERVVVARGGRGTI